MRFSLKELRARKNETQSETVNAVGVSKTTYVAWKKDISRVAISAVAALAKHFGVGVNEIKY